jgi:indole-3-glycerol phosphate synthase
MPPPPPLRLSSQHFDLIAELKLRSPAVGRLQDAQVENVADRVVLYGNAGAAAVSVLTEPSRFDGSMRHLEIAARVLTVPAMRKDFLVDPYQVWEARAAGAGGILVILRMLARVELNDLIDVALSQNMFVLLEAFDETDIDLGAELIGARAAHKQQLLLGINSRDLVTLKVMPGRLESLAPRLPRDVLRVAESGVATSLDAARMAQAGYDLALVGSALMADREPRVLAESMLRAGRAARVDGER